MPDAPPVTLVTPDGGVATFGPEDAERALSQGYRPPTPQEQHAIAVHEDSQGLGQTLASAAEGAGSALTFGLSPKIETALGITTPEMIAARKEAHPIAHGLGTAAGIIAPLALTGGAAAPAEAGALGAARTAAGFTAPALIAKAGRAVAGATEGALPGAVGRVLPALAAGATEGGLYAGSDVTEKALLGDPNLTWEKAASEIGMGGLFGGALGGGGKMLGELLPANLGESLADKLGETAGTRNIKAASGPGGSKELIDKIQKQVGGKRNLAAIGQEMGEHGLVGPLSSPEQTHTLAEALKDSAGKEMGSVLDAADAAGEGAPKVKDLIGRAREDILKPLAENPLEQGVAKQMEGILDGYEEKLAGPQSDSDSQIVFHGSPHGSIGQFNFDKVSPNGNAGAAGWGASFTEDANDARQFVEASHGKGRAHVYSASIPRNSELLNSDTPIASQSSKIRAAALEFQELAAASADPEIRQLAANAEDWTGGNLYQRLKMLRGDLSPLMASKHASEWLRSRGIPGLVTRETGIREMVIWDPSKIKSWAQAGSGDAGTVGFRDLHDIRREVDKKLYGLRGTQDPNGTAFKEALHDFRSLLSDELNQGLERSGLASDAWKASNRKYQVASVAQRLAEHGILKHDGNNLMSLTEIMAGLTGAASHGLGMGAISSVATHFAREHASGILGWAATGAQKRLLLLAKRNDKALLDATSAIFSGARGEAAAGGASKTAERFSDGGLVTPEKYADVSSSLRHYGSNLDALSSDVAKQTSTLADHAPGTASAAAQFAARVVTHLGSKLPQDVGTRQLLDPPYEPSASELAAYNRHHEIAQRGPVAMLEHAAKGSLHPDHVEASAAMYPRLHAEAQHLVTDRLAELMAQKKRLPMAVRGPVGMVLGSDLEHATTPQAILSAQMAYQNAPGHQQEQSGGGKARNVETQFSSRSESGSQGNSMRLRKA